MVGTDTRGKSMYETILPKEGILIMGSESHGISENLKNQCDELVCIPNFSMQKSCESLNVGVATGMILSQIKNQ